ncbi:MAG: methyltransferase domain-containing protein [Deltaproteobacteria bacterium]|nr:methyltransferase domain-containing protein [Deltaproteobacteria bacterium]
MRYTREMARSGYVHGEPDDDEVARLVRQARFVAAFSLDTFEAPPGARVLDVGTGVGAMAAQLVRLCPGITLTGVDVSGTQIARARVVHPIATYVQADGASLPFESGSFDRVHMSWVLEHVTDPLPILHEIRRVLTTDGVAHLSEVDHHTLVVEPPIDELRETMAIMNDVQRAIGGDPFVGAKLESLAREAGFTRVSTRRVLLRGDDHDRQVREELHAQFAGLCESLGDALEPADMERARRAAALLRARGDGTLLEYQPVVVRAFP